MHAPLSSVQLAAYTLGLTCNAAGEAVPSLKTIYDRRIPIHLELVQKDESFTTNSASTRAKDACCEAMRLVEIACVTAINSSERQLRTSAALQDYWENRSEAEARFG
jgi:hypothetical protein